MSSAIAISRARVEARASSILATKQKVALLTVDPARRLGVALGLEDTASRESHLDASNFKIVSKEEANLSVFQLDAKKEFFELLETYNFTIDENTVFDQELSVDPEMLGRIFENLLAEINPETGSSERKRTGSFYTPRQIVEYMVDQSLIEY